MTTFFVLAFVVLPLAIALVVLLFRGRGFIFNLVFVVVFVIEQVSVAIRKRLV